MGIHRSARYYRELIFLLPATEYLSTCLDAEKVARAWARVVLSVIVRFFVTTSKVSGLEAVFSRDG